MNDAVLTSHFQLSPPVSGYWGRFAQGIVKLPSWAMSTILVTLTVLIGWLDYLSSWEMSLFVLYALPIMLAVWYGGQFAGIIVAGLCAAAWWFANESENPYATTLGYVWAMLSRLFYFSVVVFAVSTVRNKQEADAAHIKMLEERRQLEHDIVEVSEYEQQRIGQDLHDGICQQLAAIGCAQRLLAEDLQAQNNPFADDALLIEESIRNAVLDTRNLARGIFPVHVDRSGLSVSLAELAQMTTRLTGVDISVHEKAEVHVTDPDVSMHLYRIAQEAVANAIRHGAATQITLTIENDADMLLLRIVDNGCGIKTREGSGKEGMGLRTMRYRAEGMGAQLQIDSPLGGGTIISCTLPVQQHPTS